VGSGGTADSKTFSKGYSHRAVARAALVASLLTLTVGPSNAAPVGAPRLQTANPAPRPLPPEVVRARAILDARLASLGRTFGGRVGLAVRDVQTGWTSSYNGTAPMPQQSVSKFWVALTAMEKVDRRELDLNKQITITRSDLTLFNQPIAQFVKGNGYKTTLSDLLFRALTQSDNTANDAVLRSAGGPDAVRAFLARHNIQGVRFGPGERLLQSQTAGLSWRQEYAIGRAFEAARSALPMKTRQAALERYLADPMDGATAIGLVDGLTKLKRGQLLSQASTQRVLQIMSNTRTGPQRLKGGLEPGWTCAHKTGTGQNLGGTTAGFNDVGIITSPDGQSYAVAVMIGRTTKTIPERWKLMNETVRAVIDYHRNIQSA
jgi:beta-lactamase class A